MHALASLSSPATSPASRIAARDTPGGEQSGAQFSSLLEALTAGAAPGESGSEATAPLPPPAAGLPAGIGLPGVDESGKMLPPGLPAAAEADPSNDPEAEVGDGGAAILLAPVGGPPALPAPQAAPVPPPVARDVRAEHDAAASAGQIEGRGGWPVPVTLTLPEKRRGAPAASPTTGSVGSVAVVMDASPAERPVRSAPAESPERRAAVATSHPAAGEQQETPAGERHAESRPADALARLTTEAPALPGREGPVATPSLAQPLPPSPGTTGAFSGVPTAGAGSLHELAAIVDRLAAAREVLAPASAALALDHAEFGEMTLRFEQQQDGRLLVNLSAQDAEAHRAVAAALATERNPASGGDRAGGESQAHGQHRTGAGAGGGGASERGAGGGPGHQTGGQRHDAPRQQSSTQWRASAPGENRQGGIYA